MLEVGWVKVISVGNGLGSGSKNGVGLAWPRTESGWPLEVGNGLGVGSKEAVCFSVLQGVAVDLGGW